jgi:hypothetical protein
MHWRSPRRGTLRQTRLVFALHPSPPRTASPGSGQGCPAFRPVSRFSPVAAEPSLRKCRPSRLQERVTLRRHPGSRTVAAEHATPTPSLIRLRRSGGTPSLRSPMWCSLLPAIAHFASDGGSLTCFKTTPGAPVFISDGAPGRAVCAGLSALGSPLRGSVEGLYES